MQLQLRTVDGLGWGGPIHWSRKNCRQGYDAWYGLSYRGRQDIEWVRVVIWQRGDGKPTGAGGRRIDNPLT